MKASDTDPAACPKGSGGMKRRIPVIAAVTVVFLCILVSGWLFPMSAHAVAYWNDAEIVTLINAEREKAGVPKLMVWEELKPAARTRAAESLVLFSHFRPDGSEWWTADSLRLDGELLAYGQKTMRKMVSAWMSSPGHREVMLNAKYKTIAVASVMRGDGACFTAVSFSFNELPQQSLFGPYAGIQQQNLNPSYAVAVP